MIFIWPGNNIPSIYFKQIIKEDNEQYSETKKNLKKSIIELRHNVSEIYYMFVYLNLH